MKFIDEPERFRGDGSRNRNGEDLEEFLEHYDARKYDMPSNTVDIIVFKSSGPYRDPDQPLKLLMVKRSNHPCIGWWALPGGFAEMRENLRSSAARELEEETGIKDLPLIQLRTWGDYRRDPRWRVITTSFLSLVEEELSVRAGDDAAEACWMDVRIRKPTGNGGLFELTLGEKSRGLQLKAEVYREKIGKMPLTEWDYKLVSSEGIACDHACLILQAYLRLKEEVFGS